jgi:phosphoglycolate phosphatase/beta-phosphoglucomutase
MQVRTIIFDLDGTLADTEELHFEAYKYVLLAEGIELSKTDYFSRLVGRKDHDCFALLLREHCMPVREARINELIAHKSALYQAIAVERAVFFPGALDFVRRCAARFPLALVTGTLRVEAELLLRKGEIRELFAEIVAAEDVERGKPAPDGFSLALRRLGRISGRQRSFAAAECLAVEDTQAGVTAAQQAGMRVVAVAQTVPPAELLNADLVRPSLEQTDLNDVLRQLASI